MLFNLLCCNAVECGGGGQRRCAGWLETTAGWLLLITRLQVAAQHSWQITPPSLACLLACSLLTLPPSLPPSLLPSSVSPLPPSFLPSSLLPPSLPAAEVEVGAVSRSRAPKLRRSGLGDRLAQKGYSFEIAVRGGGECGSGGGWAGRGVRRVVVC